MDDPRIQELSQRLELLLKRQDEFAKEIAALRAHRQSGGEAYKQKLLAFVGRNN